jgi:hypothetical protein
MVRMRLLECNRLMLYSKRIMLKLLVLSRSYRHKLERTGIPLVGRIYKTLILGLILKACLTCGTDKLLQMKLRSA